MTDSKTPDDDLRIEDLPPIEPPSAGFIVQLFIVPLLIVSVVFGVYVLFAKMASSEADWRQLVTDVRSENPHIRWRAALGLSQLLEADRQRELHHMFNAVKWPAAGFVDTEIRCLTELESGNATKEVQPRVQA